MKDEATFLRMLAADPENKDLSRVFADWLEERGDPRAAWVRDPVIWRHARPDFRDPIPGLAAELGSAQRRYQITRALASFGAAAVPAVVAAMRTDDENIREHGKAVLGAIGPAAAGYAL